ncbi:hypothetical protein Tco_0214319 [Tanacetum coccineum]
MSPTISFRSFKKPKQYELQGFLEQHADGRRATGAGEVALPLGIKDNDSSFPVGCVPLPLCGQSSKRWTLCNTGVLSTPKAGTAETPNAGVLYGPKAVVLETPKPGALDPKGELETSWLPAPKVDEPNALLREAGCDCANELPKGPDVKSKLPNAGFCANMDDLPKGDDEAASNAVLEVAPGCLIAVIKWVSDHPFGISNSGLKNVMSNKPNLNVSSCTVSENRSTRVWILAYAGFFGGLRFIFLHIMMGVWITAYTSLQVLRT